MGALIDLVGQRFGRLSVVSRAGSSPDKKALWLCCCDCGQEVVTMGRYLTKGDTRSCGCLQKETIGNIARRHGRKFTREYGSWQSMKERCHNPRNAGYYKYGARGISVCARWRHSFENFYADIGDCPTGMTLDRIDNDGNYEPGNCRWATPTEQAANRRTTRLITVHGEQMTAREAADRYGVSFNTLRNSRYRGQDLGSLIERLIA